MAIFNSKLFVYRMVYIYICTMLIGVDCPSFFPLQKASWWIILGVLSSVSWNASGFPLESGQRLDHL